MSTLSRLAWRAGAGIAAISSGWWGLYGRPRLDSFKAAEPRDFAGQDITSLKPWELYALHVKLASAKHADQQGWEGPFNPVDVLGWAYSSSLRDVFLQHGGTRLLTHMLHTHTTHICAENGDASVRHSFEALVQLVQLLKTFCSDPAAATHIANSLTAEHWIDLSLLRAGLPSADPTEQQLRLQLSAEVAELHEVLLTACRDKTTLTVTPPLGLQVLPEPALPMAEAVRMLSIWTTSSSSPSAPVDPSILDAMERFFNKLDGLHDLPPGHSYEIVKNAPLPVQAAVCAASLIGLPAPDVAGSTLGLAACAHASHLSDAHSLIAHAAVFPSLITFGKALTTTGGALLEPAQAATLQILCQLVNTSCLHLDTSPAHRQAIREPAHIAALLRSFAAAMGGVAVKHLYTSPGGVATSLLESMAISTATAAQLVAHTTDASLIEGHAAWCGQMLQPLHMLLVSCAGYDDAGNPASLLVEKNWMATTKCLSGLIARHSQQPHLLDPHEALFAAVYRPTYSDAPLQACMQAFAEVSGGKTNDWMARAKATLTEQLSKEATAVVASPRDVAVLPAWVDDELGAPELVQISASEARDLMNPPSTLKAKMTKQYHKIFAQPNDHGNGTIWAVGPDGDVPLVPSIVDCLLAATRNGSQQQISLAAETLQALTRHSGENGSTATVRDCVAQTWLLSCLHGACSRLPQETNLPVAKELSRWMSRHVRLMTKHAEVPLPLQQAPYYVQGKAVDRVHNLAIVGKLPPMSHDAFLPPLQGSLALAIHETKALSYICSQRSSQEVVPYLLSAGILTPMLQLLDSTLQQWTSPRPSDLRQQEALAALRQLVRCIANIEHCVGTDPRAQSFVSAIRSNAETIKALTGEALQLARPEARGDIKLSCQATRALENLNRCVLGSVDSWGDMLFPLFDNTKQHDWPVIDIVLVHGLMGAAIKTWRTPLDPVEAGAEAPYNIFTKKEGQRMAIWPVYWLAKELADRSIACRIMSVTYDADMWASSIRPARQLKEIAIELETQLKELHVGQRPTTYMAHSMGGLLTKELLTLPQAADLRSTASLCAFYGVPHLGSKQAEQAMKALPHLHKYLSIKFTSPHVATLGGSNELQQLNTRFAEAMENSPNIRVLDLCEGKPTKFLSAVGLQSRVPYTEYTIVPEASAISQLGEVVRVSEADHVNICKPPSPLDIRYTAVRDAILAGLETR